MHKKILSALLSCALLLSLLAIPPMAAHRAYAADIGDPDGIVKSTTKDTVRLAWAPAPGAAGYRVYRSDRPNGTYARITAADLSDNRYDDSGRTANMRYFYKIVSVSGGTESSLSEASALTQPDFGPNVYVFDGAMPQADIQETATKVFQTQERNQFGSERYALLFKPGAYDVSVRIGFYTQVAGLGLKPDDVNINGGVTVDAEWWSDPKTPYNATQNFWRSVENLAVTPAGGNMKYAVSQAASMRRLHVKGDLTLHDRGGWASGGYLADSQIDGTVGSGSQQQWFSRNNDWKAWNGSNWNMVFVGNTNAPADSDYPSKPYTTVDRTPVIGEKPYLTYDESAGRYNVIVPKVGSQVNGTGWKGKTDQQIRDDSASISIEDFYVAKPDTFDVDSVNAALRQGKHLLLTPGVYALGKPIEIVNANTVVLGLGLATLHANDGTEAIKVADVDGVKIAGLLFEADKVSSKVLLQVGPRGSKADHAANPTRLYDLYFRVGGDALALADICIEINSNSVIGDHFWVWRADHGTGAAWDSNLTTNGLVVNGNDVTVYGLFVEHFHEYQTLWNGENGRVYFYQCEIPYDVPDQASWMSSGGAVNGYAGYKVAETVKNHEAYGLGVYSFFRDAAVKLESAIEVPDTPGVRIHHATSVFLSGIAGSEISHIVNNSGQAVTVSGKNERLTDYLPRTAASIAPVTRSTIAGRAPVLPGYVTLTFTDGTSKPVPVVWDVADDSKYAAEGSYVASGNIASSPIQASAQINVAKAPDIPVAAIAVTGAGGAAAIESKGGTLRMSAAVSPAGADLKDVVWSVVNLNGSATDKATIDEDGLLAALKDGQVRVVATAVDGTGVQGEATIAIRNQIVKAAEIVVAGEGGAKAIAFKGATLRMVADVRPANADDRTVTWSVTNETGQATIDAGGLLTPKANGTVRVVATAKDGSGMTGQLTIAISGQDAKLSGGWSWTNERPDQWSIIPGQDNSNKLRMNTQEGRWTDNNLSNILLRDPGASDFSFSAKIDFNATANYEFAGLVVYQDGGNAITLGRNFSGSKQLRFSKITKPGSSVSQDDRNDADTLLPDPVYLKIEKTGSAYKGFYSRDGKDWTQVTTITHTASLSNPKIGLFTRKVGPASKMAEFSDFKVTANGSEVTIPFWQPVSSIQVQGDDGAGRIGEQAGTLQMRAQVLPANATFGGVRWTVVNADGTPTDKASIGDDGLLTALRNGQVKVVATAQDGTGTRGEAAIEISGQPVPVSRIAVTDEEGAAAIATKGGTLRLSAAVSPDDATDASVVWAVYNVDRSETDLATINPDGLLTAVKDGRVLVVATARDGSGVDGELTVTISGQIVRVIHIAVAGEDDAAAIATKGGTLQLSAAISPDDATDASVVWAVYNADRSETDLATINPDGLLTAVKDGRVLVVATARDGSGVDGELTVTISGQADPIPDPEVPVTAIVVSAKDDAKTITAKGGTLQLAAAVSPDDASIKSVQWSVYNADRQPTDLATIGQDGLLTAVKDGQVLVVATASDGSGVTGELTVTISGQSEQSGCTSSCGGDPTPAPTTPVVPAEPIKDYRQTVTAAQMTDASNGRAVVSLAPGKTEAVIPVSAAQRVAQAVEIVSGGLSLTIPPAVFHRLTDSLPASGSGSSVLVRIASAPAASTDAAAGLRLGSQVYQLELVLAGPDGKERALDLFPEPVQLVLPYASGLDAQLLGIYRYDDAAGEWVYAGGKASEDKKTIATDLAHFSQYAVLEYDKRFEDVAPSHWAYRTLKVLAARHVVTGISATSFNPGGSTTRAEFVALLTRALGLQASSASASLARFSDVRAADWYAQDVAAALEAGWIKGVSDTRFAPNEVITREQMAVLLVRAYAYAHGASSAADRLSALQDGNDVSAWAASEVNLALELELMKGRSAAVFAPRANAARAETAQAIYNLLNRIESER